MSLDEVVSVTDKAVSSTEEIVEPKYRIRAGFAEVLASVLGVESVSSGSHFFDDLGADSMVMAQFCARVRKRDGLPSVAMRDIYRYPTVEGLVEALAPEVPVVPAVPAGGREGLVAGFAEVLASVLGVESVSSGSHFFDDLGADSMVMAQFCARVRKRDGLPSVAMRDIYRHPTIEGLVAALAPEAPTAPAEPADEPATSGSSEATVAPGVRRAGKGSYLLCGALQITYVVAYSSLMLAIVVRGYEWVAEPDPWVDIVRRSFLVAAVMFLVAVTLPIAVKWVVIGRWRPQEIPVWSLAYLRFWIVKTAVRSNPLALLFVGSPLYVLYLRALGAKIGPGVVIFSRSMPVCTDLLTIGAGTVIRKDALLSCYRAHDGVIQTGPVSVGAGAFVGEAAVLDIHASMSDNTQLGHASSLHSGQHVPDGQSWHGTPAEPQGGNYRLPPEGRSRRLRRFLYPAGQLLLVVVGLPFFFAVADLLLNTVYLSPLLDSTAMHMVESSFYLATALICAVLIVVGLVVSLIVVFTVPRLLNRFVPPEREWPLYGARYAAHRLIGAMTNVRPHRVLFGDSSYIVPYLRALGYRLDPVEQTGSNFGLMFKHENPFLCTVGTGTMVADGLSFLNTVYSDTSFRLSRAAIGDRSFLGNFVVYPTDSRAADNVLLATKVMVPVDGPVRDHTGLLGAPSMTIPRTVRRDAALALGSRGEFRRRLSAKNRHNVATMGLYLFVRWLWAFLALVVLGLAFDLYHLIGLLAAPVLSVTMIVFTVSFWAVVDRRVAPLQTLAPQGCSIYDVAFWRHERFWKVPSHTYRLLANGTPFKGLLWRLAGVRVGKRLFDDGVDMSEKTFVTIGDDCTFNAGTHVQCHSQEDGAFKSDRIVLGSRCTLGVAAFVHYGTTVGDDVTLEPDSFLMKGEEIPDGEHWAGNPASTASTEIARSTTPSLPRG